MKYIELERYFTILKKLLRVKLNIYSDTKYKIKNKDREMFLKLTPDEKHKIISPQLELYTMAVSKRSETLPIMATLAAALIAIVTLRNDLVVLSLSESRFLLSLFLFIIPVTLHHYIYVNEKAAMNALDVVGSYQGKNISEFFDNITFLNQLSSDFPRIIVYILYGVITFVLLKIWFLNI